MKALVYRGPSQKALEERPKPALLFPTDAIVRITMTMICSTDLHILNGDVPSCTPGRILGHEGLGVVEQVGAAVESFRPGDRVLISCISACGECQYCRRLMYSQCTPGGWSLGNRIDGTHAEFVRIPFADSSLYHVPPGIDEEALVLVSDILPTGVACGALNGRIRPGSSVAIVGACTVGLAALVTVQFSSPFEVFVIDSDDDNLAVALRFGASATVRNSRSAARELRRLTHGRGVDVAIDAQGSLESFELCEEILAEGGSIVSVGALGAKVAVHLENLWDSDAAITTRLADTIKTPMLLDILRSRRIDPELLSVHQRRVSHRFSLDRILDAYDALAQGAHSPDLRVLIQA